MNDPYRSVEPRSQSEIEAFASITRIMLGLDSHDRADMAKIFEWEIEDKINPEFVFEVFHGDNIRGVEGLTDLSRPAIRLSLRTYDDLRKGKPRARSTMAHELGHLVMHCQEPVHYARRTKKDRHCDPEWQADSFAAAFLMPAAGVKKFRTIQEVMNHFGVSYTAAKRRARTIRHRLRDESSGIRGYPVKPSTP